MPKKLAKKESVKNDSSKTPPVLVSEDSKKSADSQIIESKNFDKNQGKISQFFNRLVAYGGFNINEGVMYVWGDPSIFVPMPAFVEMFRYLEKKIGEGDTHEIFYWLGRVYGKNSTLMLANRFGIDKKDIPEFINGATQDGMGLLYLKQENHFKNGITQGIIEGTNSVFAEEYYKRYGKQKNPIDFYLLGILSGGGEPLYNTPIIGKEIECVARGDKCCIYDLKSIESLPKTNFFQNLDIKESEILEKARVLTLNRKSSFKFLGKKEIEFGDGSFKLKSIKGINLPVYGLVLLNYIVKNYLKDEKIILEENISRCFIESIKPRLQKKDLRDILKELEIFGYGKFEIKVAGQKNVIISNESNPYPKDYLQIFGRNKEPVDTFVCSLIQEALKVNNKKSIVKETTCRARGDSACTFKIDFI
jgi:predicted hydrocarbon binding protein